MPPLKNPRHEAVSQKYAAQLLDPTTKPNQTEIYSEVYGVSGMTATVNGSKVLSSTNVSTRIAEIINQANPVEEISRDLAEMRRAERNIYNNGDKIDTVPDWTSRGNALNIWLRANNVGQGNNSVTINEDNRSLNLISANPTTINNAVAGLMELNKSLELDGSDAVDIYSGQSPAE